VVAIEVGMAADVVELAISPTVTAALPRVLHLDRAAAGEAMVAADRMIDTEDGTVTATTAPVVPTQSLLDPATVAATVIATVTATVTAIAKVGMEAAMTTHASEATKETTMTTPVQTVAAIKLFRVLKCT
jgi:F0F1-type ATP synthase beta subunit